MNKVTKTNIEEMVNEIVALLEDAQVANDTSYYFNNKCIRISENTNWHRTHIRDDNFIAKYDHTLEEDVTPLDYFKYANIHHIFSMSFEGDFYEIINEDYSNFKILNEFEAILEKYGLYYELGNDWNLTVYPIDSNTEYETTEYVPKPEPIYLYYYNIDIYPDLKAIADKWREYQDKVGDVGSCVLGAGFNFTRGGKQFFMSPCSRYQGSISWETNIKDIKKLLEDVGCENVWFNYGHMD